MKKKTLSKTKIVLEDDWLVMYSWKKTWWIFGHWYADGSTNHDVDMKAMRISNQTVGDVIWDKFIGSTV